MTHKITTKIVTVCLTAGLAIGTLVGCTPETTDSNSPVSVTGVDSQEVVALSPEGAASFINEYYQQLNDIPSVELDKADKIIREAISNTGLTTEQTKKIVIKHTPLLDQYHGVDEMPSKDIIALSQQIFQQAYQSKATNNQKLKIVPDAVTVEEVMFDIQSNSATYKSPLFDITMEATYQDGSWLMNPQNLLKKYEIIAPVEGNKK